MVAILTNIHLQKILTHTDIRLTKNLNAIEEVSQRLQGTLHEHHECPSDLELVLDLRETNRETEVYYYYVSWKHQAIVWVKDVDIWYLTCNHRMVYCQAHLSGWDLFGTASITRN